MGRQKALPAGVTERDGARGKKYDVRWRDPTGKSCWKTFADRDQALAHHRDVQKAIAEDRYVDTSEGRAKTFLQAYEAWMPTRRKISEETRKNEDGMMRKRVIPTIGHKHIGNVRTEQLDALFADLEHADLSTSYIRKLHQLIGGVFSYAVRRRWIAESPVHDIELPTAKKTKPILIPSPADVRLIADSIEPRYRALVVTAAYTGLRFGELAGLKWTNVDPFERKIRVWEQAKGQTKTIGSMATVSMPKIVAEALTAHGLAYPDPDKRRGLVFTSELGAPLHRHNFRKREWLPLWADEGPLHGKVRQCKFHHLRHSCASYMIAAGYTILQVQKQMRHARASITLDTYGHLMSEDIDLDRLDRMAQEVEG